MKGAKEEGMHWETVFRGAEVYVTESHPVLQKCQVPTSGQVLPSAATGELSL